MSDPRRSSGARVTALGSYRIRTHIDAFAARRAVRTHAMAMGFARLEGEELALVTSELCTNVVKYGVAGALTVERVEHVVHGVAIVLAAEDVGPPFHDFDRAMRDGRDDRGTIPPEALYARRGIGAGLGAIRRMTHAVWLEPLDRGKRVVAARYVSAPRAR